MRTLGPAKPATASPPRPRSRLLALAAGLALAGCTGSTAVSSDDAAAPDLSTLDDLAGPADLAPAPDLAEAPAPTYDYRPPPAGAPPKGLEPATWVSHYTDDILPYWTLDAAKGTPVGNFPTYRGMDGSLQGASTRKPRMIGRQVFAYCVGFLLTGDEQLLDLARAGARWLLDHARDKQRGGWYADLDAAGAQYQDSDKTAQDMAYAVMGLGAYFYVTRDAEAEAAVLATRDLLFDPGKYWDAPNGRIKDAMDGALAVEKYVGRAGSWELVAQLDPVTAFLLLDQPVFTDAARRDQVLADLRTLALRIRESFWKDGIFWGSTGAIGSYGSNHTDFGHILKSYWALTQIDKRLQDQPLRQFLGTRGPATLGLAFDALYDRWAKAPTSPTDVSYGSDWWAYAEADQLAATLALHDPQWIDKVAKTSGHFREDYVDRTRPAREVVSSINRQGYWVYSWPDKDTAKCNEWKNGFHSSEHALVMFLFSHYVAGTPAPLHFALPAAKLQELAAATPPYTFAGRVASVEDLRPLAADPTRHVARLSFDQLR